VSLIWAQRLVFVHLGHAALEEDWLCVCVCGGCGWWGISSIVQVTLPSEPLLLAWECCKKSPAKGPAPFVCSGFMVCWPPDPIWASDYTDKHVHFRKLLQEELLNQIKQWSD